MRDIKFRAWHKEYKRMYKIGQITLEKGIWNYEPENREYIGMSIPYQPSFILMQFTGLYDKNGKEIYEGDVVKYGNMMGKIIFLEGCFVLSDFEEQEEWTLEYILDEIEVIGNIYDNKNLLEEG